MAASYVSVFLPAVQQLALAPLLGPYPQAYRASQLRSLRRAPADLITGRIISFGLPRQRVSNVWAIPAAPAHGAVRYNFSNQFPRGTYQILLGCPYVINCSLFALVLDEKPVLVDCG